jgi:hypothetical protein
LINDIFNMLYQCARIKPSPRNLQRAGKPGRKALKVLGLRR